MQKYCSHNSKQFEHKHHVFRKDKLANTSSESELCFRPLYPQLESSLDVVWKKNQVFSPAAKLFLQKLLEKFSV